MKRGRAKAAAACGVPDAIGTDAAHDVFGEAPDPSSPRGSRDIASRGDPNNVTLPSVAPDIASDLSSAASSRTSDFSDGTYVSSSDSGSGISLPSFTYEDDELVWASKFKETLGDSSDVVECDASDGVYGY